MMSDDGRPGGPSQGESEASPLRASVPDALRVLVCGGRTFENRKLAGRVFRSLAAEAPIACLIQGGARGADYIGKIWAEGQGLPVIEMRANWVRYGKRAGPIRNQWMLDHGKPDVVVAFPGGTGTLDMIMRTEAAGVRLLRVTEGAQAIEAGAAATQCGPQGESAVREDAPGGGINPINVKEMVK